MQAESNAKTTFKSLRAISISETNSGSVRHFNDLCNEFTKQILLATLSNDIKTKLNKLYTEKYNDKLPAAYKDKIVQNALALIKTCKEKLKTEDAKKRLFEKRKEIFRNFTINQVTDERFVEAFNITIVQDGLFPALRILYDKEKTIEEEFLTTLSQDITMSITQDSLGELIESIQNISQCLEEGINDQFNDDKAKKQNAIQAINALCQELTSNLQGAIKENVNFTPSLQFYSQRFIEVTSFNSTNLRIVSNYTTISTLIESITDAQTTKAASDTILETYGDGNPLGILPVFGNVIATYMDRLFGANKEDISKPTLTSLNAILDDLLKPHTQDNNSAPIYLDLQNNTVRANFNYTDENAQKTCHDICISNLPK